jgi:hypothetical protein
MDTDRNITATFRPIPTTSSFTLTLDGTGTGGGTINISYPFGDPSPTELTCDYPLADGPCAFDIPGNLPIQLTATAGVDATFDGWGGACDGVPDDYPAGTPGANCYLIMFEPKDVTATFSTVVTPPGDYLLTLRILAGEGTVTSNPAGINCIEPAAGQEFVFCEASFTAGTVVDLSAFPVEFVSTYGLWYVDGVLGDPAYCARDSCQVTMNADRIIGVTFNPDSPPTTATLTIDIEQGQGEGIVTDGAAGNILCSYPPPVGGANDCTQTYPAGTSVTLNATATNPWLLIALGSFGVVDWSCPDGADNTCTATVILSTDTTVPVTFGLF